jgi:antitoxin MazE
MARMTVTLCRWGNSLAVRLPKDALDRIHLVEGDCLQVDVERGRIVLRPQTPSLEELIAKITRENLHPAELEGPVGAETW